jgi:hypothetical protein
VIVHTLVSALGPCLNSNLKFEKIIGNPDKKETNEFHQSKASKHLRMLPSFVKWQETLSIELFSFKRLGLTLV